MAQDRKSENAVMTVSLKDSVELVEMKMLWWVGGLEWVREMNFGKFKGAVAESDVILDTRSGKYDPYSRYASSTTQARIQRT